MANKVLIKGNEAIAMGAIDAGLDAYFGYPITPQNEIIEYLSKEMPKNNRVFVQAESEIASANMMLGAAASGAASMTSSSGPGISLMQETISYMAGCELPAVIVNVMRGGPGLGNIAPAQGDYSQATKGGGHGDYKVIVIAPNNIYEMYSFMEKAFKLAFKYRNPVMVLSDGILGQMIENVDISKKNKKIKKNTKLWSVKNTKLRKKRLISSLRIIPEKLAKLNLKLYKKYEKIEKNEQESECYKMEDAKIAIVAYGFSSRIAREIVDELRKKGERIGMIRPITLWPFPKEKIKKYRKKIKEFWVLELSFGQMVNDVKLYVEGESKVRFYGELGGALPNKQKVMDFFKKTDKLINF